VSAADQIALALYIVTMNGLILFQRWHYNREVEWWRLAPDERIERLRQGMFAPPDETRDEKEAKEHDEGQEEEAGRD